MGTLDTQLSTEAADFLADFGESITYTPDGGSAKSITAVVDRNPLASVPTAGRAVARNLVQVTLANHATTGVTAIKEGFDTVALKLRRDDAATTTLVIRRVIEAESDAGMWRLEAST